MPPLEEVLSQHEKGVEAALKQAGQMVSALKAWKKATAEGNLLDRHKQAERSRELTAGLAAPIAELADSWDFDPKPYLASDRWRKDLIDAAGKVGHRVFEEGDDLVSSPVVVKADPQKVGLRIGKQRWPKLRPSCVVAELRRIHERGENDKGAQETLEGLYNAAKYLDPQSVTSGKIRAKLRDIYDLFAITPGWKKENSDASFAQALYALHRSEVRVTRSGKKCDFEFPSGNPKDRDIFAVVDDSGRTIRYYMVHFL